MVQRKSKGLRVVEESDPLRESLSDSLRDIYVNAKEDVFGALADECIRQMEWATECGRDEIRLQAPRLPITPAPEDWKP